MAATYVDKPEQPNYLRMHLKLEFPSFRMSAHPSVRPSVCLPACMRAHAVSCIAIYFREDEHFLESSPQLVWAGTRVANVYVYHTRSNCVTQSDRTLVVWEGNFGIDRTHTQWDGVTREPWVPLRICYKFDS